MTIEKSNGYDLLQALLDAFSQGTEAVLDLFNQDAIVKYPYAASMGIPASFTMNEYKIHLDRMLGNMPGIFFTGLKVYALQEKDSYWAEVHGETSIPSTNALYQQDYVIHFTLKDGKFSEYKEYWNVLPVLRSLLGKDEVQRIMNDNN